MADMLEDDSVDDHQFGHSEWDKLEENFVNAGYREGITAGKEGALQEGFDEGFAGPYGAPLGRDLGSLRGITGGLMAYLDSRDGSEELRKEVREIVKILAGLKPSELVPPDLHALEHAREHGDEGVIQDAGDERTQRSQAKRKVLGDVKARVNKILAELELSIDV